MRKYAKKDPRRGLPRSDSLLGEQSKKMRKALAKARAVSGARSARGSFLPLFMWCDIAMTLLITSLFVVHNLREGYSRDDWMFWSTAYYLKIWLGLASFPFLVFLLPVLGGSLTHAKATGYDKKGNLVPLLSSAMKKKKFAREQEAHEREEYVQVLKSPTKMAGAAAAAIQRRVRSLLGRNGNKEHRLPQWKLRKGGEYHSMYGNTNGSRFSQLH